MTKSGVVGAFVLVGVAACGARPTADVAVSTPVVHRPTVTPLPAPDAGPVAAAAAPPSADDPFAGTWTGAAALTVRCDHEAPSVDQEELELVIVRDGHTLQVTRDGCTAPLFLRGTRAALRSAVRCGDELIAAWSLSRRGDALDISVTRRLESPDQDRCTSKLHGALSRK